MVISVLVKLDHAINFSVNRMNITCATIRSIVIFKRDYFLAGGLDPDTVGEAIRLLEPFAVDVSSGVETDGVKDEEKIEMFINAVKYGGKYA
jgi:phosphoribosylanthranilate isomerase